MFVLQIYRKERTGEKTGAEGQRRKRERKDRQGGEKRENGSFWKLLDRRQFAPHQSQNPSVKRLMSWRSPSTKAWGRNSSGITQKAEQGLSGSF